MSISPKELALNQKLHNLLEGNLPEVTDLPAKLLSLLIENDEIFFHLFFFLYK